MGRDKAGLLVGGRTLAQRTADLLRRAGLGGPLLELGPGVSDLEAVPDARPGAGPLAAVATGVAALRGAGFAGAALVVATDLPRLEVELLTWLGAHPGPGSVVPVRDGRPQWLCARYGAAALDAAGPLVASGRTALRELAGAAPLHLAEPGEWLHGSLHPGVLDDVDTPDDLAGAGVGP